MAEPEKWYRLETSWSWWRENHGCSRWEAFLLVLRIDLWNPVNGVYCWAWLRTVGRWRLQRMDAKFKKLTGRSIFDGS